MIVWLSVKLLPNRSLLIALRFGLAVLCCLGVWQSARILWADHLFRQDTPQSIHSAIGLVPDSSDYYMRLSQLDPDHARPLLETALRMNRYNAQADIDLGLRYEADGDYPSAEKLLLSAFSIDHTYVPRWTLANFYFRRDNPASFWKWARLAAGMPADDVGPLFALCWHESPDPDKIASEILNDNPSLIRQYMAFLLARGQFDAASRVTPRLIQYGSRDYDAPFLQLAANHMVDAYQGLSGAAIWTALREKGWVTADATTVNNPSFDRAPADSRFDWLLREAPGAHSTITPHGLKSEFDGNEPENLLLAEQAVILHPGDYVLTYSCRTTGIAPDTGLHWEIARDSSSPTAPVIVTPDLFGDTQQNISVPFTVSGETALFRIRLIYRRALGTTRIAGTLVIPSVQIYSTKKS